MAHPNRLTYEKLCDLEAQANAARALAKLPSQATAISEAMADVSSDYVHGRDGGPSGLRLLQLCADVAH